MTNPGYMLGTILVGIAMVFSLYCQAKIKSTYAKYRRRPNSRGITGAQVAREILDSHGMTHVPVYEVKGELSDHFDPSNNSVSLSSDIYHGTTIAACAVAAHECGHAIQDKENYTFIEQKHYNTLKKKLQKVLEGSPIDDAYTINTKKQQSKIISFPNKIEVKDKITKKR